MKPGRRLAMISTEAERALGRERGIADYRRSIGVCRRAAGRMQAIVERLLALARADASPEERRTPIHLDELVGTVTHDLQPLSDARHLDVAIEASPVCCLGDPDRLLDAVTNVVMNAIQYNVDGGRLRVEVRQTAGHAEIVVEDTGVGIAPEHLPHVFEPFFRADPARSREAGGAGLGLAVTRATVRRHGGDVVCHSTPGRGTTFIIRLALVA